MRSWLLFIGPVRAEAKDLAAARALLRDPELTVEEVAKRLGVAPSTLYANLPGGRGALTASTHPEPPV